MPISYCFNTNIFHYIFDSCIFQAIFFFFLMSMRVKKTMLVKVLQISTKLTLAKEKVQPMNFWRSSYIIYHKSKMSNRTWALIKALTISLWLWDIINTQKRYLGDKARFIIFLLESVFTYLLWAGIWCWIAENIRSGIYLSDSLLMIAFYGSLRQSHLMRYVYWNVILKAARETHMHFNISSWVRQTSGFFPHLRVTPDERSKMRERSFWVKTGRNFEQCWFNCLFQILPLDR